MSPHFGPEADHDIDALLRAHLDRQAAAIDPQPLYARICASSPAPAVRAAKARLLSGAVRVRLAWGVLGAAAVILAFISGVHVGPARASAEALLREAQQVHQLPLDRCYLVTLRHEAGWSAQPVPEPSPQRVTRLWTRGDRFWIESVGPKWRLAWGRDEDGSVWYTFGPRRGLRVDADEVPPWLALLCDVNSMRLDTLLAEALRDYDLRREKPGPDSLPTTEVIRATLRPGQPPRPIRSVLLEVDLETKVLRRVVISRYRNGQPLATTTYDLVETDPQPDANFRLEGHLREPFEIYTRAYQPEEREKILARIYGLKAARSLKSPTEKRTPQEATP